METHNIDSKIRKAIEESADFYDAEAGKSKERIWQHIQRKKQVQANIMASVEFYNINSFSFVLFD